MEPEKNSKNQTFEKKEWSTVVNSLEKTLDGFEFGDLHLATPGVVNEIPKFVDIMPGTITEENSMVLEDSYIPTSQINTKTDNDSF